MAQWRWGGGVIVQFVDEIAGIYFRSILIPEAGEKIEQHVHPYDHATYCGSGRARLYVNGIFQCDVEAGQAIEVKANLHHQFEALEPNTRLTCVHNTQSAAFIKESGI